MRKCVLLLMAALLIMAIPVMAAKVKNVPIVNEQDLVFQAYPGSSCLCDDLDSGTSEPSQSVFHGGNASAVGFAAYDLSTDDPITCVPGILAIDGGDYAWAPGPSLSDPDDDIFKLTWSNYVQASYQDGIPWFDRDDPTAPALSYYIKDVELVKLQPLLGQAFDYPCWEQTAPLRQHGSENIRLWWPLMYEVPGTEWQLTVTYGTKSLYDDDGAGPNLPAYVHTEIWSWEVDATLDSLQCAIRLFHELPQGCCQVPLISGDRYWFFTNFTLDSTDDWGNYGSLYLQLLGILDETIAASGDTTTQGELLVEFELLVSDNCVFACPAKGAVAGPNVGIVQTEENPVCYKLLVDAEWIADALDAFQDAK